MARRKALEGSGTRESLLFRASHEPKKWVSDQRCTHSYRRREVSVGPQHRRQAHPPTGCEVQAPFSLGPISRHSAEQRQGGGSGPPSVYLLRNRQRKTTLIHRSQIWKQISTSHVSFRCAIRLFASTANKLSRLKSRQKLAELTRLTESSDRQLKGPFYVVRNARRMGLSLLSADRGKLLHGRRRWPSLRNSPRS